MSIEQELTEAFKRNESALVCPPSLDARIMAQYERLTVDMRGKSLMKKNWGIPKIAIIALIAAVISGFAYAGNKFLFSDSQGHYSVRLQTNEAFALKPEVLEKARTSLREVQAQLAPGETAVVYLPEVAAQFDGAQPAIGVTNPDYITDASRWKAVMEEQRIVEPIPDSLLGKYRFAGGTENDPFHILMGLDAMTALDEMKAESERTGGDRPLWRLTQAPSDISSPYYTTVYRDAGGEALYFSWVIYGDAVTLEGIAPPSTVYEELDLNGGKAHYTKNEQSLYGDSNVLQSVMWIEEEGDRTVVYQVESDSMNMPKEKLIEAASSLK